MKNNLLRLTLIITLTTLGGDSSLFAMNMNNANIKMLLGEPLKRYGLSLHDARDNDNKKALEAKIKQEIDKKANARNTLNLAQLALVKTAAAATLPAKKATRTSLQKLLYASFKEQNKFNADLPTEIWESIIATSEVHKKIMPIAVASARILAKHTNSIYSVAWSPNGLHLATGSFDNTARLWNATNGTCMHTLHGHRYSINLVAVAWSPNGLHLATGSSDNTARLWNSTNGTCMHTLHGHTNNIYSVAWSPDGLRLATGSSDRTARLWNTANGICMHTLHGHNNNIYSVAWSPDGLRLATGSYDHTARLWNATNGTCVHILGGHRYSINSVAWSPNSLHLATGSSDHTARLWNATNGVCMHTLHGHTGNINSVAWSPNGLHLATGSSDQTARLWDAANGTCMHVLHGHTGRINSVAWSPNGLQLATGSSDHTARLWNIEFLNDPKYKEFIRGQLTQEQYMLLLLLETCKRENNNEIQSTSLRVIAKKINNPAITSHTLIEVLASFHPVVAQGIVDHYKIANGKNMLQGAKEMHETQQAIFAGGPLLPLSDIETIIAEYLMGPQRLIATKSKN